MSRCKGGASMALEGYPPVRRICHPIHAVVEGKRCEEELFQVCRPRPNVWPKKKRHPVCYRTGRLATSRRRQKRGVVHPRPRSATGKKLLKP